MLRRLRIAASVFFAVVCVALCVLWVRSYYHVDFMELKTSARLLKIDSERGRLRFQHFGPQTGLLRNELTLGKTFVSRPVGREREPTGAASFWGFELHRQRFFNTVFIPHWFVVLTFVTLAAIPWFPYSFRFSLRTMLIATTLVAAVLGLVCYTVG